MLWQPTQPFPLYLLPPNPFRRRRSSADSIATSSTLSPSTSPPTHPTSFLSMPPTSHLRCQKCLSDLIPTSCIISKGFTGRHGRAYLVSPPDVSSLYPLGSNRMATAGDCGMAKGELPNTHEHKPVPRQLVTGPHTVADISCRMCGTVLGWKYVQAEEESQKYKVGKYILETRRIVRGVEWEYDDEHNAANLGKREQGPADDIEFDSQDEDECEDLFSGVWTPGLARRRRKHKMFQREHQ